MLHEVAAERAKAEGRLAGSVEVARLAGVSWDDIGHALGVSGQTARRRYPDLP
jgi:hypothetical protein